MTDAQIPTAGMSLMIDPGQYLYRDEVPWLVIECLPAGVFNIRSTITKHVETLSSNDLLEELESGHLTIGDGYVRPEEQKILNSRKVMFDALDEKHKEETWKIVTYSKRLAAIEDSTDAKLSACIDEVAAELNDKNPPKPSTAYRWRKKWMLTKSVAAMAPGFAFRGGRGVWRLNKQVEALIDEAIHEVYLTRNQFSRRKVYYRAIRLVGDFNKTQSVEGKLQLPGFNTVMRRLRALDDAIVVEAREGKRKSELLYRQNGVVPKCRFPLEIVEVDHATIDEFVCDPKTGVVLGRPCITAIIDRYSGMPLGFDVSFDGPTSRKVGAALAHAIKMKSYVGVVYPDIINVWPTNGVPFSILSDNGSEFHSRNFRRKCKRLGIEIVYAPAMRPRYKGQIERWFKSLNLKFIHGTTGTTRGSVAKRGDEKPEQQPLLSIGELRHMIHRCIIDDFIQPFKPTSLHSPIRAWNKGIEKCKVRSPNSIEDVEELLFVTEHRDVTLNGIRFQNLRYVSDDFGLIRSTAKGSVRVEIQYNPQDLSSIRYRNPVTKMLSIAHSVDPLYTTGLSLDAHYHFLEASVADGETGKDVSIERLCRTRDLVREKYMELQSRAERRHAAYSDRKARRKSRVKTDEEWVSADDDFEIVANDARESIRSGVDYESVAISMKIPEELPSNNAIDNQSMPPARDAILQSNHRANTKRSRNNIDSNSDVPDFTSSEIQHDR